MLNKFKKCKSVLSYTYYKFKEIMRNFIFIITIKILINMNKIKGITIVVIFPKNL